MTNKEFLIALYGNYCPVCKTKMQNKNPNSSNYATLDHIVPKSKGGQRNIENCRVICKKCNMQKGSSLPEAGKYYMDYNGLYHFLNND